MRKNKLTWLPQAIASLMLLWALNPDNPYGYYMLLRIVVCAICAYLAFAAYAAEKIGWVWVLSVTAVIYNPIVRIYLNREYWTVINIATIILLVLSIWAIGLTESDDEESR